MIELLVGLLFGLLVITCSLVFIGISFLPAIVAFRRGHEYRWPIFIVNLFLGWTLIGYVVALVWAFMPEGKLS
jgi:hypothetical protein